MTTDLDTLSTALYAKVDDELGGALWMGRPPVLTDSEPCLMSRPTVQRSQLAGWAGYGYCASHLRFYWG